MARATGPEPDRPGEPRSGESRRGSLPGWWKWSDTEALKASSRTGVPVRLRPRARLPPAAFFRTFTCRPARSTMAPCRVHATSGVRGFMGKVVGIDLGTTNSVCAYMDNGDPRVIINEEGGRVTPSVVGFSKSGERF